MPDNTALVTDAAQDAAQTALDDYAAGVSAHISGDWGHHNQIAVSRRSFVEPVTGHKISTICFRMALTHRELPFVVKIPIFESTEAPVLGAAPYLILQPAPLSVAAGSSATFSVVAASAVPVSYQWLKNSAAIVGKTSSSLVFTSVQTTDQGSYSCQVINSYGSIVSAAATLTVT